MAGEERLSLVAFAAACNLEPDRIQRFVWLGLLDPVEETEDGTGFLFEPAQLATVARIQRLHHGLSIDYSAVGVVMDLLDRIEELERRLRRT
jgi:chaperone modulatory protein CbpM